MNSQYVVIVYKEVGKDPEYRKIENNIQAFESLLGGEITTIHFEDIEIVYRKDSDNLRPNIYIRPDFLSIGLSIRGNLFVINKIDDTFVTLNKEQAIKCKEMLKIKSFHYENFDEYGRYVPHKKKNQRKKRSYDLQATNTNESVKPKYPDIITSETETGDPIVDNLTKIPGIKLVAVNEEQDKNINENTTNSVEEDHLNEVDLEEVLKMILGMQSIILKFIKSITG